MPLSIVAVAKRRHRNRTTSLNPLAGCQREVIRCPTRRITSSMKLHLVCMKEVEFRVRIKRVGDSRGRRRRSKGRSREGSGRETRRMDRWVRRVVVAPSRLSWRSKRWMRLTQWPCFWRPTRTKVKHMSTRWRASINSGKLLFLFVCSIFNLF